MHVRVLRIGWAAVMATAGLALATAAHAARHIPIPRPSPLAQAAPVEQSDPIGALLRQQALEEQQRAALPVVIGLKLDESANHARFAIELSDPLDVKVFYLANPDRIVIDMPEVLWRVSDDDPPSGKGLIRSYRYGLFRKGNSRFVIDLAGPAKVETPQLVPPENGYGFRLMIDVTPMTRNEFMARVGWPDAERPQPPAPQVAPGSPRRPNTLPVIVIDPGHGGIDPGTHGQAGTLEKNVVLAVAKELGRVLQATRRYKVQLTRDTDVFIPLRERVAIARAAHGDLFVSLHADSNEHRDVRGASVYTLSEAASDKEADKLAEKENMSDVIAGVDLSGESSPVASILIDLAQRDTLNRSARFAETVVAMLPAATMVRPTTPHRSAGFAVLKAPDVPAVLIELGYLTNGQDERIMTTESWRRDVANVLRRAVDAHFAAPSQPLAAGTRQADSR